MLDLTKIAGQMQGISQHLMQETAANRQRLERAQQSLTDSLPLQSEIVNKQQRWRDRLLFAAAVPVEPLDTRIDLSVAPKSHTVIATDGSQIAPSHHEIAYCYLINVGRVMLHYGQSLHPLLDSIPEVFYQPEDLYVSRQWNIRTEEWMGYKRTVSEASMLAELACNWVNANYPEIGNTSKKGNSLETDILPQQLTALPAPIPFTGRQSRKAGGKIAAEISQQYHHQESQPSFTTEIAGGSQQPKSKVPILAMVDGSLIYWFLEQLPTEARDRILPPILEAWNQLRAAGVPLMGYLSASRSTEGLNFLRLPACIHPVPDCVKYCINLDRTPCQIFDSLRDTILWASQLEPGQRGPLWRSSAKILDLYDAHPIYFCYVHVGTEIARIEVPGWVAEDSELFDRSLSLMLAQVQKGYGYPVALAEAHNQAVVRGGDRARFFALLEQQMIKAGLRNVGISYKETRKRGSIA